MTYICKTVVIVHVDGKRKEIAQGAPLPAGVDEDAMDDLIRLGAIERHVVQADILAARTEAPQAEAPATGTAEAPQVDGADAGTAAETTAEQTDRDANDAKPRGRRAKAD